jgi:hypothetical protein
MKQLAFEQMPIEQMLQCRSPNILRIKISVEQLPFNEISLEQLLQG